MIIPVPVIWVGLQSVIVVFPDHTHLLFGQNQISSVGGDAL